MDGYEALEYAMLMYSYPLLATVPLWLCAAEVSIAAQHHPGKPLLQAMAQEAANKLDGFNAQNVANSLWAFANLGERLLDEFDLHGRYIIYNSSGM